MLVMGVDRVEERQPFGPHHAPPRPPLLSAALPSSQEPHACLSALAVGCQNQNREEEALCVVDRHRAHAPFLPSLPPSLPPSPLKQQTNQTQATTHARYHG